MENFEQAEYAGEIFSFQSQGLTWTLRKTRPRITLEIRRPNRHLVYSYDSDGYRSNITVDCTQRIHEALPELIRRIQERVPDLEKRLEPFLAAAH